MPFINTVPGYFIYKWLHLFWVVSSGKSPAHITSSISNMSTNREVTFLLVINQSLDNNRYDWNENRTQLNLTKTGSLTLVRMYIPLEAYASPYRLYRALYKFYISLLIINTILIMP